MEAVWNAEQSGAMLLIYLSRNATILVIKHKYRGCHHIETTTPIKIVKKQVNRANKNKEMTSAETRYDRVQYTVSSQDAISCYCTQMECNE